MNERTNLKSNENGKYFRTAKFVPLNEHSMKIAGTGAVEILKKAKNILWGILLCVLVEKLEYGQVSFVWVNRYG